MILNTKEEFLKTINENKISIIYFFAQWCGPCKYFAPVYEQTSAANSKINMNKIDIDELPEIAADYGILSIPTLIAFQNGKEIDRIIGVPSSLQNWINNVNV